MHFFDYARLIPVIKFHTYLTNSVIGVSESYSSSSITLMSTGKKKQTKLKLYLFIVIPIIIVCARKRSDKPCFVIVIGSFSWVLCNGALY